MRWALVKNGVVSSVVKWDGEGEIFDEYETIEIGDEPVAEGWLYANGVFTNPDAPPVPTNDELYEKELSDLNNAYDADKRSLAYEYLTAGLFDGASEATKKAEIYSRLQALNQKYATDIDALDEKYGG